MDLTNSKRLLLTASHVSSKFTPADNRSLNGQPAGALKKSHLLRGLSITARELPQVRDALVRQQQSHVAQDFERLLSTTTELARGSISHLDLAKNVAFVSDEALVSFAELVGTALQRPAASFLAGVFQQQQKISPIGRLYLERMEMYPIGVERGEMVFTVPMAPGESVTISHKEWSLSSSEFEDIVQDYFESYSERGVAEKTDTSVSTENEGRRSNTLNFGATLSGGYGPVTLTTSLGITNVRDDRESIKRSTQNNREVTEKASARVRKEHKISVKLETKKGVEDNSFRTIVNSAATPVRIDYYRMMRKWRTDLFRYGLRMTYDIALPSPGVRIWARWRRVAELDAAIRTTMTFTLRPEDLNDGNWQAEADKVGASVPPPPVPEIAIAVTGTIDWLDGDAAEITRFGRLDFTVPDGYRLEASTATATLAVWPGEAVIFRWLNGGSSPAIVPNHGNPVVTGDLFDLKHRTGALSASYVYTWVSFANLTVLLTFSRTPETYQRWRHDAWSAIRAAAEARHHEYVARLQEERDRLYHQLVAKDTLSLRRLEREEMLRLVVLWLLGPDSGYSNAPAGVEATVEQMVTNERSFFAGAPGGESPTFKAVTGSAWSQALIFGDLVKFIQQAVEWENLLYFLYPYFWGDEAQGRERLLFEHPDPEHQNFLRSGYARVVITVRPGFEEDFTRLVETGSLGGSYKSPYLPIAQEIANLARTNYMGIPPANPEKHARPLLYPQQRKTWEIMERVIQAIEDYQIANGEYPHSLADLPAGLETTDAWGNALQYKFPGTGNDYDLISLGSDGVVGGEDTAADISASAGASLIASWFDYTPTSGLDIAIDSKADEIA